MCMSEPQKITMKEGGSLFSCLHRQDTQQWKWMLIKWNETLQKFPMVLPEMLFQRWGYSSVDILLAWHALIPGFCPQWQHKLNVVVSTCNTSTMDTEVGRLLQRELPKNLSHNINKQTNKASKLSKPNYTHYTNYTHTLPNQTILIDC